MGSLVIADKLRLIYEKSLERYFAFEGAHFVSFPRSPEELDENISEYVELLWEDGEPRYWAETTLSGFTRSVLSLRVTRA